MKEQLVRSLLAYISESVRIDEGKGALRLTTPLLDLDGDPVELFVHEADGTLVAHDGGRAASLLFELDQHLVESPGYRLVKSLADAHEFTIDFNEGTVAASLDGPESGARAWILAEFVASLCQTLPHMKVPQKERPALGARLRQRVTRTMRKLDVLSLVEQRYKVPGSRVEEWTIDFYYRPTTGFVEDASEVVVNTVDLDVLDPIPKAEHAMTLAMDVRKANPNAAIRVVFDTHGRNSLSEQAASLIRGYSEELKYSSFDYGDAEDKDRFSSLLERELLKDDPLFREIRYTSLRSASLPKLLAPGEDYNSEP